jgi:protein TonB
MSMETRNLPDESFGALQGCLVEGSLEQRAQQRRIRRRSLTISVLLQAAVLVAVVLVPLFSKTERIALANVTPVPPYSRYREVRSRQPLPRDSGAKNRCSFCPPTHIPQTIVMHPREEGDDPGEPNIPGVLPGGPEAMGLIPVADARPRRPDIDKTDPPRPRMVHITTIDPAMLKHRVDPVYPVLMKQTHREGRVEIHALISEDGTMQSLQVVGGDPMFFSSALEAVQLWIYKPTYLNGKPVQVDTTITVIYSMQR